MIDKDLFSGGGLLGDLIRSKDWSKTPLGPMNNWPEKLKENVTQLLSSFNDNTIEEISVKTDIPYQTFAEAMPQMAFIADSEGNIIYYNQRWYEYVAGIEGTEGWGWKEKNVHHPDDLKATLEKWNFCLQTGKPYEIEYRLLRHDGEYIWHLGRAMPIRNTEGKIEFWLGTNTDIHKQKETEEALRVEREKLQAIIENMDVGVGMTDQQGNTLSMNKAGLRMHQFENESEMLSDFKDYTEEFDLQFPDGREMTVDHWPSMLAIKGEKVKDYEVKLVSRKRNKFKYISYTAVPIYDNKGGLLSLVFTMIDLTDRKKAEENLKHSEALYRMLAANLPSGAAFILDPHLTYVLAEGQAIKQAGFASSDFEGKTIWEALDEETAKLYEPICKEALRGNASSFEHTSHNRYYKSEVTPIINSKGSLTHILAVSYDITERKSLEEQLNKERELLQTIFDTIPIMISVYDPHIEVTSLNKAIERITGWTMEDHNTHNIMNLAYPDPDYRKEQAEYMISLAPGFKDISMYTKSGKVVETSWANVKISDGRNVGIGVDISERKAYETQLAELSRQLQTVVDNINDGVIVYSPEGVLLEMNKAAKKIVGYLSENSGQKVNEYKLYDQEGNLVPFEEWPIQRCLRGDYFLKAEYRTVNTENERDLILEYSSIPVFEQDKLTLAVITVQDITERKKAQLQIIKANEDLNLKNSQLSKTNELHENLLYIIAHDLRGPIANMYLIADILEKLSIENRQNELVGALRQMVNKQDNVVKGLVEVIELQSVQETISKKIYFENLVHDILKEEENALEKRKGTIKYNFELAPAINHVQTFVNSILKNLISNAIKYSKDNEPLMVELNTSRVGDYTLLKVEDNGIGIDLIKNSKLMFQPFKRFSSQASGTGIGLYLVKSLIEKNNGYVTVESEPGKGTIFYCYFKEYINECS